MTTLQSLIQKPKHYLDIQKESIYKLIYFVDMRCIHHTYIKCMYMRLFFCFKLLCPVIILHWSDLSLVGMMPNILSLSKSVVHILGIYMHNRILPAFFSNIR